MDGEITGKQESYLHSGKFQAVPQDLPVVEPIKKLRHFFP